MTTDVRAIIANVPWVGDTAAANADAVLAALASHGVELVADLPDVEVEGGVVQAGSTWTPRGRSARDVRRQAMEWLSLARHLEAREAEPEHADVAALARLVAEVGAGGGTSNEDVARYLFEAGARLPEGGAS